jgi:peptidoglycan L-alanyl-D-glutamate endopeptidase CwlK
MTSAFNWSLRSSKELTGIHPDLRAVADKALKLSPQDFIVIDGVRTIAEQQHYVAVGASQTLKSRHLHGFAIDVVPLVMKKVRWELPFFVPIVVAFKDAASELGIPIVCGYDWKGHWDAGHFELRKKEYPDP